MKKLLILFLMVSVTSCSVDTEMSDLDAEYEGLNLSAEASSTECFWISYDFEQYGQVSVINDDEIVHIKVIPSSNFELSSAKLHATEVGENGSRTSNFPTVGKGNLPPGQLEYSKDAQPGDNEIIFELSRSDFENNEILIAVQASFTDGENDFEVWAGDEEGNAGGWLYFSYQFQNCEECEEEVTAGPDYNITFSTAYQAANLNTRAKIDRFFANLVTEYDNDDINLVQGTFVPTIQEFINAFQAGERNFEITYTVGEGVCEDSSMIIIEVVESDVATINIEPIEE